MYEPDRRRQERGQSQIHLCGARGIDRRQRAQAAIQKTPFKKKKKCCSLCNSKIIEQICLGRGAGRLFLTVSRRWAQPGAVRGACGSCSVLSPVQTNTSCTAPQAPARAGQHTAPAGNGPGPQPMLFSHSSGSLFRVRDLVAWLEVPWFPKPFLAAQLLRSESRTSR